MFFKELFVVFYLLCKLNIVSRSKKIFHKKILEIGRDSGNRTRFARRDRAASFASGPYLVFFLFVLPMGFEPTFSGRKPDVLDRIDDRSIKKAERGGIEPHPVTRTSRLAGGPDRHHGSLSK